MGRILIKYVIPLLLLVFVVTSIFLMVKNSQYEEDIAGLEASCQRIKKRGAALQQKYTQEKSRRATLQRTNRTLQAENENFKKKIEILEQDLKTSKGARASISRKMEQEIAGYKMNLTLKTRQIEGLKAAVKAQTDEQAKTLKIISEREKTIGDKENEIERLGMVIKAAEQKIKRIVAHNQRLCKIGENLLAQLDSKGIFGEILKNEPFTQAKRIELEKMIQDYLDRIDKERLITTDG